MTRFFPWGPAKCGVTIITNGLGSLGAIYTLCTKEEFREAGPLSKVTVFSYLEGGSFS